MAHSSIELSQASLRGTRSHLRGAFVFATLSVLPICYSQSLYAQTDLRIQACAAGTCSSYCRKGDLPAREVAECLGQCEQSCLTPNPQPITVTPKYLIMALVYAPPGCTTGPTAQCGTSNGSSLVDYNTGSANGTKVSTKDSFQLGVTISYDNSAIIDGIGAGASYGFSETTSDTTAVNVTKSQSNEIKVPGNGDGIDHGQDMFLLLLHPSVTLQKTGDQILWSFTKGGDLYEVYVSELRRSATMRPTIASTLKELGFTNDDYQSILSEDPFGGKVSVSSTTLAESSMANTSSGTFTTGANTGPALDPQRFWLTGWTFPYEPSKPSTSCNGGVCNCAAITNSFTNDKLTDITQEDDGQTTVDLNGSVGVPKVWSLKLDTKMVWTTSATTDNSTDSKQTATATLTCPSINYTGDTGMYVYWDSRYGSFVFIPYDPGSTASIHKGQVLNASGHAVGGQLVEMTYAGKTYHTFTGPDGTYSFPSSTGKPALMGTAQIATGGLRQTVNVGLVQSSVIHMK